MDPILTFAQHLNTVIPTDIDEYEGNNLLFNIVLVKFGARPSTLLDSYKITGLLIDFIRHDSDLTVGQFTTERENEVWIYNKNYSNLFKEKDISHYDQKTIHKIRGNRLGYPCSGYFTEAYETPSLITTIYLNDNNFYGYICPVTQKNGYYGVDMWYKFKPSVLNLH